MDFFDRQKRIPDWNQSLVEEQVCLCLGCGGLGCTVALDLVRLGVKKIFIVDKDVVDVHNLNRQILFSKDDIGKKKVEAAFKNLQHHNLRTEIVPLHINVLTEWAKVVEIGRECTVVFNMIDVGEYLDLAVQSLALKYNIPFCLGGTFRTTITVDYFPAKKKPHPSQEKKEEDSPRACWACITDVGNKELLQKLLPDKIEQYKSIDFITPDNNPTGASNVYVCCTCCNFMVSMFLQSLHNMNVPSRLIFYFNTFEIDKWNMEAKLDCSLCSSVKK